MQQNQFKLEKERDLGEIITDTFTFIRINFKDLTQVFIKFILPIMLISVIAGVYYQYASQEFTSSNLLINNNPFEVLQNLTALIIPLIFTLVSAILFYVFSYLAILASMKCFKETGQIELDFVSNEIKSRFWSMTGLLIVSFLILVFSAALCGLPFFYFIVPVSIMFSILVFEDKSVGESISHAFTLIKENFWMTLLTIIVIALIIAFASGIFQVPILIYSMFTMVTKLEANTVDYESLLEVDWVMLSLTAIGNFGSSIFSLVTIIAFALIYFNLNEKHTMSGTVQEIDSIGSN